jgi:hypothetical protein
MYGSKLQEDWKHSVAKDAKVHEMRIYLSFRYQIPQQLVPLVTYQKKHKTTTQKTLRPHVSDHFCEHCHVVERKTAFFKSFGAAKRN